MVTSDFRPEVEIRPFRACAMKNTQYNAYLWTNLRNSRIIKEIGVEKHDGDDRFLTGSGNIALSFMRHASGHNYRNSSFIVDVAMGQIPRSTKRISSFSSIFPYLIIIIIWLILIVIILRNNVMRVLSVTINSYSGFKQVNRTRA